MSSYNVGSVLSVIPLFWTPLLFMLSIIGFVLTVSMEQVHAVECGIGDSDFPFCASDADDQSDENEEDEGTEDQDDDQSDENEEDEANRETSSSSSSAQDTSEDSGSSSRSTSEAGCVSNTFEPEEPEIKRDGNTIT
ncbi:MAG: hypothetical protein WAL46_04645, partial [Nitrososphaeraceae archaeon]